MFIFFSVFTSRMCLIISRCFELDRPEKLSRVLTRVYYRVYNSVHPANKTYWSSLPRRCRSEGIMRLCSLHLNHDFLCCHGCVTFSAVICLDLLDHVSSMLVHLSLLFGSQDIDISSLCNCSPPLFHIKPPSRLSFSQTFETSGECRNLRFV